MSDPLNLDSISFWYRNGRSLLKDFSLILDPGTLLLVQGGNGSGKSTFIKILATLFLPRKGRISLGTLDFEKHSQMIRPWIGLASGPQQGFYSILTAQENLKFFYGLRFPKKPFPIGESQDLADKLGLDRDALKLPVRQFSNGMRQKLGLVRAFMGQPKIILLDEPFSCLDTASENRFAVLLNEKKSEKEAVIVIASPKDESARIIGVTPDHQLRFSSLDNPGINAEVKGRRA